MTHPWRRAVAGAVTTVAAVVTASILTASLAVEAQPVKVPRIGYLTGNLATGSHLRDAFLQGLRDLGYVERKNVLVEYGNAEGKYDRFPALATELVARKVDVIVVTNTPAALAAKQATRTIPIVLAWVADPVGSGLVTNLARPGGNITGLSFLAPELVGKRLELLREVVPRASRVAALWHPGDFGERTEKQMRAEEDVAARALGLKLQVVEVRGPDELDRAFSDMTTAHVDAVIVQSTNVFFIERRRLVALAAKSRLPAMYLGREFVDVGGLMSYEANVADLFRRAATYVDTILKGARPGDLPVEQPTRFELVINLKTARALGLTIPPSLLLRADQVIKQ